MYSILVQKFPASQFTRKILAWADSGLPLSVLLLLFKEKNVTSYRNNLCYNKISYIMKCLWESFY